MAALLRPHFRHRQNDDGSFDSSCSTCFVIVASAENESNVVSNESMHKCDAVRLYQESQTGSAPASRVSVSRSRHSVRSSCRTLGWG